VSAALLFATRERVMRRSQLRSKSTAHLTHRWRGSSGQPRCRAWQAAAHSNRRLAQPPHACTRTGTRGMSGMRVWRRRCAVPWAAPREDPPRIRWHIPLGSLAGLRKGVSAFQQTRLGGHLSDCAWVVVVEASLTFDRTTQVATRPPDKPGRSLLDNRFGPISSSILRFADVLEGHNLLRAPPQATYSGSASSDH
jgi:hypothetical protein